MQVNYSNAFVDQLVHLFKKVGQDSLVYNFDKDSAVQFNGRTIKYVKSKFPHAGVVNTLFELGKKNGVTIQDYNGQKKKADGALTNGRHLENTTQFIDRMTELCNSTKSTSYISMNLPACYNAGWFAYQPNLFKEIAKQNDYGLSYFRLSDHSNNHAVAVDVEVDNNTYKELMHKYQHTADIRLGVTFKKDNNTNKFIFKEDK